MNHQIILYTCIVASILSLIILFYIIKKAIKSALKETLNINSEKKLGVVFSIELPSLQKGHIVEHETYGLGTMKSISGEGEHKIGEIDFQMHGIKNIAFKAHKLKVLNPFLSNQLVPTAI